MFIPCLIFLHREIGQKGPQDLSRDASGVKGYAVFITELAERTPALVLSNMSVLLPHLDGEVHSHSITCLEAGGRWRCCYPVFPLKTDLGTYFTEIKKPKPVLKFNRFWYKGSRKHIHCLSIPHVRVQETAHWSEIPAVVLVLQYLRSLSLCCLLSCSEKPEEFLLSVLDFWLASRVGLLWLAGTAMLTQY